MDKFLLIIGFAFVLGCSKTDEMSSDHCVPIGISAVVDATIDIDEPEYYHPETRTSYPTNGSTASFIAGDKLGITETLTARTNVQFTLGSSVWTPTSKMYWKNGTSTHTFYAYYPYNSNSTSSKAGIPILNNQIVSTTPDPACDMLVSSKQQARSSGTPPTLSATATPMRVLILPVTTALTAAPTVAFTINDGGSLTTAATSIGNTTFAAGSKYTYTVTISRTEITISTPTINDWNSVAGNPITPSIL